MLFHSLAKKIVTRIEQFNTGLSVLGISALIVAIVLVVVDVVIRWVGGTAFLGTVDITQLCVMAAAFWSIPYAFSKGSHVSVDLLESFIPHRAKLFLDIIAAFIGFSVIAFIFYLSWGRAFLQLSYGDQSLNIAIPMIIYWFFLLSGCLVACVALLGLIVKKSIEFFKS